MIGFCKCDICGKVYHQDENKNYDGIMIWYADQETGTTMHGNRKYDIIAPNGETMKGSPEMMYVLPALDDSVTGLNHLRRRTNNERNL